MYPEALELRRRSSLWLLYTFMRSQLEIVCATEAYIL